MATNISTTVVQTANMTPTVTLVNGDTLNLFATGLVLAGGAVSVGVVAGDNSTFNVGGDILSLNYKGIEAGNASVFNIAATATVFGRDWAVWSGGGTTLTNAGDLGALTRAIQFLVKATRSTIRETSEAPLAMLF